MTNIAPHDIAIGTRHMANGGTEFVVTGYESAHQVQILFLDSGFSTTVTAGQVRRGNILDRLARSASGVGFVGIGEFNSMNSRAASSSWRSMLNRCYNKEYQAKKARTYADCNVCEEWQDFQNFARWHMNNYKKTNEKMELDKDLLIFGNKTYSPDACIFVPGWLNVLTVGANNIRGNHPVGVSKRKGKDDFEAYCNHNGKRIHLGIHSTEESAHNAWLTKKLEIAKEKKHLMDIIDERIYPNVVKIIESIK